jgi:hypothetical protein
MPSIVKDHYHEIDDPDDPVVPVLTKLLGPFAVAHDTPGIEDSDSPVELTELAANTFVIRAWLETTETWGLVAAFGGITLKGEGTGPGATVHVVEIANADVTPGTSGTPELGQDSGIGGGGTLTNRVAWLNEAGHLGFYMQRGDNGEPPTAGEGNVYALIAVPAV